MNRRAIVAALLSAGLMGLPACGEGGNSGSQTSSAPAARPRGTQPPPGSVGPSPEEGAAMPPSQQPQEQAAADPALPPSSENLGYVHQPLEVTLRYPAAWKRSEAAGPTLVLMEPSIPLSWEITLSVQDRDLSVYQAADALVESIQAQQPEMRVRDRGTVRLASGAVAGFVQYEARDQGRPVIRRQVLIPRRPRQFWLVTETAPADQWDKHAAQLAWITDTVAPADAVP